MKSQGLPLDGLRGLVPPNLPNPRVIGWGLLVVLGILLVRTSVFMVKTEEVGVVLTFGKYSHNASSKRSSVSAPSAPAAPACAHSILREGIPVSRRCSRAI